MEPRTVVSLPRQLGRYEVLAPLTHRGSPFRSAVMIARARDRTLARPTAAQDSRLALSFSPAAPNEGTKTVQRPVAIKRIAPALVRDPDHLRRFLEAARAVTAVRHATVAHVQEVGHVDEDVFLVMEYALGETAATLLGELRKRGEALAPAHAAHLIAEACAGLHTAHALELVHGQLTIHDLFVGYDGSVRVLDIGIAAARRRLVDAVGGAALDPSERALRSAELAYSSPERCRDGPFDARADVFSLGAILWHLLTGTAPFARGDDRATARAILDEALASPQTVHPAVPAPIAAITMKALSREPDRRHPTALGLRHVLRPLTRQAGLDVAAGDELAAVMQRLFETRIRDKREMLRRIDSGRTLEDLDVAEDGPELPTSPGVITVGAYALEPEAPTNVFVPAPSPAPLPGIAGGGARPTWVETPAQQRSELEPPAGSARDVAATDRTQTASGAPPRASRRPARALRIGVLVILLGSVALAARAWRARTAPAVEAAPARVDTAAPAPAPPPPASGEPAVAASNVPPADATQAPEEISLHVETVPPRATIFVDGAKRGVSPIDLKLPRGNEPVTVEIRRAGYRTVKEQVVPDVNQRLKLTLVARGAPASSASAGPYHKFE